jgi:NADH-quinone oxidoreductase subunit J
MIILFYGAAALAAVSTAAAVTRSNIVHAVLWLNMSFLSVATVFYFLGAPFAAMLEIITYAGAIMVLFTFAIMLVSPGPGAVLQERRWQPGRSWIGPSAVGVLLLAGFCIAVMSGPGGKAASSPVGPVAVGVSLFSTYLLGAELASALLLSALIGAFYLGRRDEPDTEKEGDR